jgi:eukaryotic-like serine/threonine-protein kinase
MWTVSTPASGSNPWRSSPAIRTKVLPAGVAADAKSSTRFLREAQIVAKLSHPQIVPVFASGIESGTPWYAMELVDGETLAQILKRLSLEEVDPKRCLEFATQFAGVADGLHHAHAKKIIHRDIKPSNLILDREGQLRILDFGLARLEGQETLTLSGDFLGTPQYMSPEQARRKKIPVDHRS